MFSRLIAFIRQVIHKMFPYSSIETAENVSTPLSKDMQESLDLWYDMYTNQPYWLSSENTKSLNLPSLIAAEVSRQVTLEMKWNITGKKAEDGGESVDNPRSEFLKNEFDELMVNLRQKLEQGMAAGTMIVKPYVRNGHLYFDWSMAWDIFPVAFDDDSKFADVIFRDTYSDGEKFYTRLERHIVENDSIRIVQSCYESNNQEHIGSPCALTDVQIWADIEPEVILHGTSGQLFGVYKVALANNVDIGGPMGMSIYSRATDTIKQADMQYSRTLWEYEGSELMVFMSEFALRPDKKGKRDASGTPTQRETPKRDERLMRYTFNENEDFYQIFAPTIRGTSYLEGLNAILMRIEDQCGISRGTLADPNTQARTATELKILKERTYSTVHDNQIALERCLREVIAAMDWYATTYNLAPQGEYDVSFEWDDSILTDTTQQLSERMELFSQNIVSRVEMRMWYFGETEEQAKEQIRKIDEESNELSLDNVLKSNLEAISMGGKQEDEDEEVQKPQKGTQEPRRASEDEK